MVKDAEQHRTEDARLREQIDARNQLDTAAYQVERRLGELGDAVPAHERARAEMLVADARQAVKEDAPLDRMRSLTAELQQIYHSVGAAAQGAGAGGGPSAPGSGGPGQGQPGGGPDDDVIDAEFTSG